MLYNEPSPHEIKVLTRRFGLPNSQSIDTYLAHDGYKAFEKALHMPWKDIIEEIWVHDIVDLVWEILRLRRLKVALLSSSVGRGLKKLYYERDEYSVGSLIARWSAREPAAVKKVEQFLKANGLTMDDVMAHSLVARLDEIERIDIAISRAEARRNAAQREIERRRSVFGQALQRAVQQIEHDAVVPTEGAG